MDLDYITNELPSDPELQKQKLLADGYLSAPLPQAPPRNIPQLSAVPPREQPGAALKPLESRPNNPDFNAQFSGEPAASRVKPISAVTPTPTAPVPGASMGEEIGPTPSGTQVAPMAPMHTRPKVDPNASREDYLEQKLKQQQWDKENPWGTEFNHPGTLGKIGHVLGAIGQAVAPGIAENIPGSRLNRGLQMRAEEGELNKSKAMDIAQERESSASELQKAQLESIRDQSEFNTPEKRQDYAAKNPDMLKDLSDFEKADWQLTGHFPAREPATPKEADLKQQYAESVTDDIAHGRDPATSQKTQQIADAITSLQKESGKEVNAVEQVKRNLLAAMQSGDQGKIQEYGKQLEKLGDPDGMKEMARALQMQIMQQRIAEKNAKDTTLSPAAQKILMETEPTLEQVDQLLADLEPLKNKNKLTDRLTASRIGYALGYKSNEGKLADDISKLELDRVIAGARVLRGSSRAYQALEKAMQHAPNAWVDTPALMYSKLQTIRENLADTIEDAKKYGVKNLPANVETNTARKPAAGGGGTPEGHQVGDIIIQNGKRFKATKVDKGKVTAADPL